MKTAQLFSLVVLVAQAAAGQTLEQRVTAARGTVGFEFTTRANVCGNGSSISISDDGSTGYLMRSRRSGIHIGRNYADDRSICESGPARVVIEKAGGNIVAVDVTVGGRVARADTELGAVQPSDAANYLLAIAPKLGGRAADHALMAVAIADGVSPWKRMLVIARANDASDEARKASLFWVSQEAGNVATAGLRDIAMDDDAGSKIRSDALFYLAQRKDGEGIPSLIKVVQDSKSAKLKKDAIFYLAEPRLARVGSLREIAGRTIGIG